MTGFRLRHAIIGHAFFTIMLNKLNSHHRCLVSIFELFGISSLVHIFVKNKLA